MHDLDHLQCLLFHLNDDPVDTATQVTMEDHCRDRHRQPRCSGDQGLRNPVGEYRRIADACTGDGREHLDHPDHRTQQAQQWRDVGDGAQSVEIAFQLVHHLAPFVLDRLFHHIARVIAIHQPGGEDPTQRGTLAYRGDMRRGELLFLMQLPDLGDQVCRQHLAAAIGPQPINDDRHRDHRAGNDWPHQPSTGFHEFQHVGRCS